LRHEIPDFELDAPDRRSRRIDQRLDAPPAARRAACERHFLAETARGLRRKAEALRLLPIGTAQEQGERQGIDGAPLRVAQQRHDIDGVAGAVDAALGVEEGFDRARAGTAGDAAIRQVEGRAAEIEEGEVALPIGQKRRRGVRAGPAQQARRECRLALCVGRRLAEHVLARGNKGQLHARQRIGRGERAGEDMQPVGAGHRADGDVGGDYPMRRYAGPELVISVVVLGAQVGEEMLRRRAGGILGDDEIGSGPAGLDDVRKRKGGLDSAVVIGLDRHRARPDEARGLLEQVADLVAADLPARQRADFVPAARLADPARQEPVAHPQHPHRNPLDIHRLDGEAIARRPRQDEAIARQRDLHGPVAQADLGRRLALGACARERRQASGEGDVVARAISKPAEAEIAVGDARGRGDVRLDADIVLVMRLRTPVEALAEAKASLDRRATGVDPHMAKFENRVRCGGWRVGLTSLRGRLGCLRGLGRENNRRRR
jgi:hypothetical protein